MVYKPRQPLPYHTIKSQKPVVKLLTETKPVEMSVPKLPNELIMGIIRLADGGKTAHKSKLKPVLESIKQTGGWHKWHFNNEDPLSEPPLEWACYNIDEWCEILDNNLSPFGDAFWLYDLIEAEIENYEPIYE